MALRFVEAGVNTQQLRLIMMDHSTNNPPTNQLGPGISAEQVINAVEKSGYPLQTIVGTVLRRKFDVQEEWGYVDRDSGDLRSMDMRADLRLHGWSPQPRVRPHLTLVIECKQSQLPYVFFQAESPSGLLDHPKVFGLHTPTITVSTDDDASTWVFTVIHALDLHEHGFQTAPSFCTTFSRCVRKSADLELSGTEAYSGLVLPLIKALDHLSNAERPPDTAVYFDAHLCVGLGVLDAPMIVARRDAGATRLEFTPWIRVLRHEYSEAAEAFSRDRLWALDVVHKDFLETYLESHLIPFAEQFAGRVLAHPNEIATGEAFAEGMGADSWRDVESRLRPKRFEATVKRTRSVGRNLFRFALRVGRRLR
jgi:hypothetical protein